MEYSFDHGAMEGGGFYNRNSALQAAGIECLLPIWQEVCASVGPGAEPWLIADYASSQGRNSMLPVGLAIDGLRRRGWQPIEVAHIDLPTNDFSALFEGLAGDPASYLRRHENVYPVAIGEAISRKCFPPTV
jgi:hypothetical protein